MTNQKRGWGFAAIATALLLAGIYLFPEYIRIISFIFLVAMCCEYLLSRRRIMVTPAGGVWVIYILIALCGAFANDNMMDVIEFCVSILMGLVLSMAYFGPEERKKQIKAVIFVGSIAVIGCLLQWLAPDFLTQFNMAVMSKEKYALFDGFYQGGWLVGFSFQTGVTGFYLTLLTLWLFSVLVCGAAPTKGRKILTLFGVIASAVMVFMTGKRVFILLSVLIMLGLLCMFNRHNFVRILLVGVVILAVLGLLLYNTEVGQGILDKMDAADPTTGRAAINAQLWESFLEAPLFGKGVCSSLQSVTKHQNGHNIYLQILSESGLVGFLLLAFAFVSNLFAALRLLLRQLRENRQTLYGAVCLVIQLVFIGWGFTGNPLYDVYPVMVYMISVGYVRSEFRDLSFAQNGAQAHG